MKEEAYEFLSTEFAKIQGEVRLVNNPHDFGSYPSFEIDYPEDILSANYQIDAEEFANIEEERTITASVDKWHEEAQKIEKAYSAKFGEWL
jgi:hypothetical protein